MNWIERWDSLAARIDGLLSAVNFIAQTMQSQSTFAPGTKAALRSEADALAIELRNLHTEEGANMPEAAKAALGELAANPVQMYEVAGHDVAALQSLSPLFVFRTRFSHLIRDSEMEARNATELAFEHLNRLIAVSPDVRKAWKAAFEAGEVACEKLGSVHLMSHGIWAFKVHGGGAATDLVYNEPLLPPNPTLQRSSKAIVLTEWKRVLSEGEIARAAEQGRAQSNDYSSGVLGDLELKRMRYVVLVGKRKQQVPQDVVRNGVTYRHVWIAVDPETPSTFARSKRARSK
jgi:hypothetical protein